MQRLIIVECNFSVKYMDNNALLTIVSALVGLPTSILALIKLIKFVHKRKEKTPMYLPSFSSECVGRDNEKAIIKEHILSSRSVFVYGTRGIGKTTVIGHSILEAKDELNKRKLYKKVLYHNFSGDSSYEYAYGRLSHLIDKSGLKNLEELLSEDDYLIWLDECEKTDCLNRLLGLSSRPAFIVASRDKEQERIVSASVGGDDIALMINTLQYRDAEGLLSRRFGWKLFVGNKHHAVNHEIVKLVNGHPLLLYLIKNDSLFKKDPEAFYKKYKDDINQFKIRYPGRYEEEVCKDFVKSAFGLVLDKQVEVLSSESEKALGFLGCISEDELPIINELFDGLFSKKVINELLKTKLIEVYGDSIKFKHSLVHEVLRENAGRLLGNDYTPLFNFIQMLSVLDMTGRDEGDSKISIAIFVFKHHLLDAMEYAAQNHLISNPDDELYFCYGLFILADYGYYEHVLSLMERFTPNYDFSGCYPFYSLAQIISYDGLGDYEKSINCAEEAEEYYVASAQEGKYEDVLTAFHNSLFIYLSFKKYGEALEKCKKISDYIVNQGIGDTNEYNNGLLAIISYIREVKWHYCSNEELKAFISEQIDLIRKMEDVPGFDQFDIIDAKLILAFSFAKLGNHNYAIQIYIDIINSLRRKYSFVYPLSIVTINKIAQFYYQEGDYNQANEIFRELLPFSEKVFGNGHSITEKLRFDYENNKEKMEKDGVDDSKVQFSISLNQHKKWHIVIRDLFRFK